MWCTCGAFFQNWGKKFRRTRFTQHALPGRIGCSGAQSHRRADRLHRFPPHLGEERALPSLRFPDHSSGISAARNTRKARKLYALKVGRLRRGRSPFLFNFYLEFRFLDVQQLFDGHQKLKIGRRYTTMHSLAKYPQPAAGSYIHWILDPALMATQA